jgi:hypothetical protein
MEQFPFTEHDFIFLLAVRQKGVKESRSFQLTLKVEVT